MTDSLRISGYTTGATNYIRVYTPTSSNEVGASQRHLGVFGTGFQLNGNTNTPAIQIDDAYARVEGLVVQHTVTDNSAAWAVWADPISTTTDVRISHNIVKGVISGGVTGGPSGIEVGTAGAGQVFRIWNNVVYNFPTTNGVGVSVDNGVAYVFNNTVFNCFIGIWKSSGVSGEFRNNVSVNDAVNGSFTDYGQLEFVAGVVRSHNVSSDTTSTLVVDSSCPTCLTGKTAYASYFTSTSAGLEDLRLRNTSLVLWGANGTDLSANASLSVTNDIDGSTRTRPDIGADEFGAPPGPQMLVRSGRYTGDGADGRAIYVGFQPDVVFIKRDEGSGTGDPNYPQARTSTMLGDTTKHMSFLGAGTYAGGIKSLDAAGFTLGTSANVNGNGAPFYWMAFKAAAGQLKVGTYTGNGADNRSITGIGFAPDYVMLLPESTSPPVHRSSAMPGEMTFGVDAGIYATNTVQTLEADGFQVGTAAQANQGGVTYHYVAGNATPGRLGVGQYTGNGTTLNVDTVGFEPELVMVRRATTSRPWVLKPAATGLNTDYIVFFNDYSGSAQDITQLRPFGFQVVFGLEGAGNDRVNDNGAAYYWVAFGPHHPAFLYRSVGVSPANLNSGGRTVTISNETATFSGPMPANVGVGDVLQYQVTGTWHLAFISSRASSTVYTVETATGDTPQPAVAGTAVSVYRAYTSLSSWQSQTENTSLDVSVRNFDTSRDLVALDAVMQVACYNDGPMNDTVSITSSWVTGPSNYVEILAPTGAHLVGASQRHTGVAGTGFRLAPVTTGSVNILNVNASYVRIEGLEIDGSGVSASQAVRGINIQAGLSNVGDVRIDSCVIHDLHTTLNGLSTEGSMGILDVQTAAGLGPPLLVTNNVIYDITNNVNVGHIAGIHVGSRTTSYVYNNTIYGIVNTGSACAPNCGPAWGIYAKAWPEATGVTVIAQNNYVGSVSAVNPVQTCYGTIDGGVLTQSYNVSSDATASGANSQISKTSYATYFLSVTPGSENLHLAASSLSLWGSSGANLSSSFSHDVDLQVRTLPWDIGADESNGATAVKLMSFVAVPRDGAVTLEWRTASELDNVGFHVWRGPTAQGPWTRITPAIIPGAGSSPVGHAYSWLDTGLANGVSYFYRLEDVDTSSVSTFHGPVSAVPGGAAPPPPEGGGGSGGGSGGTTTSTCPAWVLAAHGSPLPAGSSCSRHGDPDAVSFDVVSRDARGATLELRTGGFWALREPAGTVRVFVPGFDTPSEPTAPALPLRRALVDAAVGKKVRLVSAEPFELFGFPGLRPSAIGQAEAAVSSDGTVRPARRARAAPRLSRGYLPQYVARLAGTVFQGETKSAVVEMTPVRFDGYRQQLVLARRVRVRLAFTGTDATETGIGSAGRVAPRKAPYREVLAQLHTTRRGLHAAAFEDLFPSRQRGMATSVLRLQRQGQAVPFHVEPPTASFGPGSVLYFFADRVSSSTDFSGEVAWELVRGTGQALGVVLANPEGPPCASSQALASFEANKFYMPDLLEAADPWLWQAAIASPGSPVTTAPLSFTLSGVDAASPLGARLVVSLQGGSESGYTTDHHLEVRLNGSPVGDAFFSGKRPYRFDVAVPAASLIEGTNTLSLVNLGDTGVTSRVFLDRFSVSYPQAPALRAGVLEGTWAEPGIAEVAGTGAAPIVLDTTMAGMADPSSPGTTAAPRDDRADVAGTSPVKWLLGVESTGSSVRFRAEASHRYLVASREGLLSPRVSHPAPSALRDAANQADYILIAPRDFMDAAQPLVDRRQSQGLSAVAVSFEEIAETFGHGQPSPEAIRDFLSFAFHSWARPSPRYVLLLGDATYDPQHFQTASWASPLPALWAKTSYLLTASDPALAAVNGTDLLPDLAIGRLPAQTPAEAQTLVAKLLVWEDSGQGLAGPAVLVADNPDEAGDFEADVEDVRASFLASRPTQVLKLRELGASTRPAILDAFNAGASLASYVGHGGAAVWASENVLNSWDVPSLLAQSRQPLLLTLNCLNGYFVASNFDALSEALLKADGRGAIAAVSPSGLSLDGPAHQYHRAIMDEVTSGRHERLGDALLAAQRAYARSGLMPELLTIYHLLGDPATKVR